MRVRVMFADWLACAWPFEGISFETHYLSAQRRHRACIDWNRLCRRSWRPRERHRRRQCEHQFSCFNSNHIPNHEFGADNEHRAIDNSATRPNPDWPTGRRVW
jgi:hypothetical protein